MPENNSNINNDDSTQITGALPLPSTLVRVLFHRGSLSVLFFITLSDHLSSSPFSSPFQPSLSTPQPLLVIRNRVLFPGGLLRLSVGKPRSVRLIEVLLISFPPKPEHSDTTSLSFCLPTRSHRISWSVKSDLCNLSTTPPPSGEASLPSLHSSLEQAKAGREEAGEGGKEGGKGERKEGKVGCNHSSNHKV